MAKVYGDEKGDKFQWDKLKGEPLKVKLDYIFTYYGIVIALVTGGLILTISITVAAVRNSVPRVICGEIYSYETSLYEDHSEELKQILCEKQGLDPEDYRIDLSLSVIDTSNAEEYYVQLQKIMARIASADVDFYVGSPELLETFMDDEIAEDGGFRDLQELLPQELYEKLLSEDRIIFHDSKDRSIPYGIVIDNTSLTELLNSVIRGHVLACTVLAPNTEAFIDMVELIYE